jgi:hypothetical protein
MSKIVRFIIIGVVGVAIAGLALYAAGFRVVTPAGHQLSDASGTLTPRNQPGWRRAEEGAQPSQPSTIQPGSGQRRKAQGDTPAAGSGSGRQARQQSQRQPGFGPSGGILLPSKAGTVAISVSIGGKDKANFVGKDLVDHVEDTVIATADGPRKGWAVSKTLQYLGIQNYKEAVFISANGKKTAITLTQIQNQETIPLFTYNENGQLMVVSGPKVRGTNKGKLTIEDVKKSVAGRTDLLNVSDIAKVDVAG